MKSKISSFVVLFLTLLFALAPAFAAETTVKVEEPKTKVGLLEQVSVELGLAGTYDVGRGNVDRMLKEGFANGTFGTAVEGKLNLGEHVFFRANGVVPAVDRTEGGSVFDYVSGRVGLQFPTPIRLTLSGEAGVGYNLVVHQPNTVIGVGVSFDFPKYVTAAARFEHIFETRDEGRQDYDRITFSLNFRTR